MDFRELTVVVNKYLAYILNALLVAAFIGMIGFSVFGVYKMATSP
ncbi:MAG: hypothetical protein SFZ03_02760 [Candidatus Melainabacteria bacterium]|nr:hypothetical protein [Candidatus Melainabacteria bacterium]